LSNNKDEDEKLKYEESLKEYYR